ncbi:hypothetical protein PV10_02891 [Exophiala mesophila]|uniref:Uncharacterized protein n=1 Tax=Exophiala mesophila TaxID=212818 RepID=A0A0D1ZKP3_EXOME|nr:uncharacterized protein PV10_02891 [Exophiala mesophila]KIV95212.1 hypothetical protein PV10_02891 [Exophiala mesophila]
MANVLYSLPNVSFRISMSSFRSLPTRVENEGQDQPEVSMAERRRGGHFELVQHQDLFTYRYAENDRRHLTVPGFTWRQTELHQTLRQGTLNNLDGLASTQDNSQQLWESGSDCDSDKENQDPERRSQGMISFEGGNWDEDSSKENRDPEPRDGEDGVHRGQDSRESSTETPPVRVYEDSKRRRLLHALSDKSQVGTGIASIKQAAKTKVSRAIRSVSDSNLIGKVSNLFSGLSLGRNAVDGKEARRVVSAPAELFPRVAKRGERNEMGTARHSRVLAGRNDAIASVSRKPLCEI